MLDSILLRDFCCYQNVRLRIGGAGLVLVTGENLDTEGAGSNGSGKSSLFKGLGWLLFGESIDGEKGVGVIRQGARKAEGVLKFTDGHRFVRTRTKSGPGLEGFDPDGKELELDKKGLQEYIEGLFGMDWLRFRNTVLFGQRDTKRFLSPDTSDTERKDLFHKILGTSIFKQAHEVAKARALELKRSIEILEASTEAAEEKIKALDLEELKKESKAWEAKRKADVKTLKERAKAQLDTADALGSEGIVGLEAELEKLKAEKSEVGDLRKQLRTRQERVTDLRIEREAAEAEFKKLLGEAEAAGESLEAAGDGRCPVCNSDLGSGDAHEHLEGIRERGAETLDAANRAAKKRDGLAADLVKAKKRVSKVEASIEAAEAADEERDERKSELESEIGALLGAGARAEEKRAAARALLGDAKARKDATNPLAKRLAKAREDSKKWRAVFEVETAEAIKQSTERRHVLFWSKGYSPEGLPSWALDSVMPFITNRANHYLGTLSDGDVTVVFNTQSELKSTKGAIRDRISVDWTVEGVTGAPPSGGQWRKMEIATDLAFMDLACEYGAKPDLLLMDECLDGLDSEGQARVIELLKELRTKRSSVFVISHDEAVAEAFEKVIKFKKEGGISGIEEAA